MADVFCFFISTIFIFPSPLGYHAIKGPSLNNAKLYTPSTDVV